MRNYLALNLAFASYQDAATMLIYRYLVWGKSVEDVERNAAWLDGQVSFPRVDLFSMGIQYVLLDKANMAGLLTVLGSGFPFNTISGGNYFYSKDPQTDVLPPFSAGTNTPRNGWTDTAGVKRVPPPSDVAVSKPQTPNATVDFMTNLLLLYKVLIENGNTTLANSLAKFIIELQTTGGVTDPAAFQRVLDRIGALLA